MYSLSLSLRPSPRNDITRDHPERDHTLLAVEIQARLHRIAGVPGSRRVGG